MRCDATGVGFGSGAMQSQSRAGISVGQRRQGTEAEHAEERDAHSNGGAMHTTLWGAAEAQVSFVTFLSYSK